ncbi:hypothetical protein HAX54_038076 [Datura stramonium]|uniref:RanBP2-type domain-containing protein n=1 Tax=Datura stramonium TaxID=4076 RepID=A0ABS8SHT3_DATST|nr:hypothetical protein [Datura stramonium]
MLTVLNLGLQITTQIAVRTHPSPRSHSPSAAYVGSGAPLFNVYGRKPPSGRQPIYRPLHLTAPPPYTGGSVMGNGGMYGVPPLMWDRYGLALPMAPAAMAPRPGFYPDDNSQKKDGTRDNDWTCPKCGNVNFSFRTVCNMRKCNTTKPGSQVSKSAKNTKPDTPEGSWKCEKCNNINYPFRTKCNRQNCGAEKPSESKKSPSQSADENDQ